MNTIERLKKYMEEKSVSMHDVSFGARIPLQTITRWVKGGKISLVYENILHTYLTSKSY